MCPSDHHTSSSSSSSTATNTNFRLIFDMFDVDHDGKISRDDLQSFYHMLCHHDIDDGTLTSMMVAADTNQDGFVEYEEFERVLETAAGGVGEGAWGSVVIKEVFRVMDMHDGDGKLSHKDLKCFMEWAGITVTDQDIDDMIALGGGDQNDGVSLEGFMGILGLKL